jgi:hypothetical protein
MPSSSAGGHPRKRLQTPSPTQRLTSPARKRLRVGHWPTEAIRHVADGARHKKKVRKLRGGGARRPRGGKEKQEKKAGIDDRRILRLRDRSYREAEAVISDEFSMQTDALAASTGWQGRAPPKRTQEKLSQLYQSGGIYELLGTFFPVPYAMPPQ